MFSLIDGFEADDASRLENKVVNDAIQSRMI